MPTFASIFTLQTIPIWTFIIFPLLKKKEQVPVSPNGRGKYNQRNFSIIMCVLCSINFPTVYLICWIFFHFVCVFLKRSDLNCFRNTERIFFICVWFQKDEKKSAGGEKKGETKNEGEKKQAAPAATADGGGAKIVDVATTAIVLKLDLHCEGCAKKVKRSIRHYDGKRNLLYLFYFFIAVTLPEVNINLEFLFLNNFFFVRWSQSWFFLYIYIKTLKYRKNALHILPTWFGFLFVNNRLFGTLKEPTLDPHKTVQFLSNKLNQSLRFQYM